MKTQPNHRLRPLVVTREPIQGESLSSLVVRHCEANIVSRQSHLFEELGIDTGARAPSFVPFTQSHLAPALAAAFATDLTEISQRMHPALDGEGGRDRVHFYGIALERRLLEAKVRRVSPASLRRSSHHRAAWMVRALDFCPESMEALLDVCPDRGHKLGWTRCQSLARCDNCDGLLTSHARDLVPEDLRAEARASALIVSTSREDRSAAFAKLPPTFQSWLPGDAFSAVVEFGAAVGAPVGTEVAVNRSVSAGDFRAFGVADLVEGYRFAMAWPESLIEHVRRKYQARGSTSAVSCLGTLGKYMGSTAAASPLRDLIRGEVGKAIHAAGIPAKLYVRGSGAGGERVGAVTARQAEARFKITRVMLSRLEGNSPTFKGKSPGRKGTALYEIAGLERLAAARDGSVTTAAAARRLGIPIHAVRPLADANFLTECEQADVLLVYEAGRIKAASIERLRQQVSKCPSLDLRDSVELRLGLRGESRPIAWAQIVKEIVAGNLPSQAPSEPQEFLGRTRVDGSALIAILPSSSVATEGVVSCLAAARILGASEQFVAAATQAGYLSGTVRPGKSEISLQSVQAFAAKYLLSAEVAEKLGCKAAAVRYWMRDRGHAPAATIYARNLWDRASFTL